MIYQLLGALSISCGCPLRRYYLLALRKLQNSCWTLKPETSASHTSPDTHTSSPFAYPVIHSGDQHLQRWTVCRVVNSGPAYWMERIAGHAVSSHLLLWQTCTVIHVCKVKRYFDIRYSQSESVLIFIKAVHTCSSVNNWEWTFPRGWEGITFYHHMLCTVSRAAHVCFTDREKYNTQHEWKTVQGMGSQTAKAWRFVQCWNMHPYDNKIMQYDCIIDKHLIIHT